MTTFDNREKALEDKFFRDAELEFKIRIRARKDFGQWAADKIGMPTQETQSYIERLVETHFGNPDEEVVKAVMADLRKAGLTSLSHEEISEVYMDCWRQAKAGMM